MGGMLAVSIPSCVKLNNYHLRLQKAIPLSNFMFRLGQCIVILLNCQPKATKTNPYDAVSKLACVRRGKSLCLRRDDELTCLWAVGPRGRTQNIYLLHLLLLQLMDTILFKQSLILWENHRNFCLLLSTRKVAKLHLQSSAPTEHQVCQACKYVSIKRCMHCDGKYWLNCDNRPARGL